MRPTLALVAAWLSLSGILTAQPAPKLDSASVGWLQRGSTQQVTLKGEALSGITAVLITRSGMSSKPVGMSATPVAPSTPAVTLEGSGSGLSSAPVNSGQSLTLLCVVSADAALGPQELRVAGPGGVSNPLTFQLSDLLEITDPKTNTSRASAYSIPLPAALSGVINANTESDFFRFKAQAGKTVLFDVQANRNGSPLDANLILRDLDGKELLRSEDVHGLDPFVEFTPSVDGDYLLELHDLRFQGGGDYRYRLVAGRVPYLESLFPYGGKRGSSVELQWIGKNLEGVETLPVQITSDASLGRQEVRARTPLGFSNPVGFEVGDLDESSETEPNNTPDQAQNLTLPRVVNGRIGAEKDVDTFRFKAPADQKWVIEVRARSLGSRLDALLTLSDTNGTVLQRNDDAAGPDARIEFDAKKDTEYRVTLRDLTHRGGDRFGYRMSFQSPDLKPDFSVRTTGGRFRVARGGSVAIRCEVDRRNGFDGMVRIEPEGLPPGVWAPPLVLGPGTSMGWWVISANADAPLGYMALRANGVGDHNGKPLTRSVPFSEMAWITVLPSVPFELSVAPASVMAEQNTNTALEVRINRRDNFDGEIRILAEDLPGVSIPAVTLPAGQSRTRLSLQVSQNGEVGVRPVMVRAETTVNGQTLSTHATAPVPLTVQPIPMFLTAMLPGSPFFRTDPVRLSAVALPDGTQSEANQTQFVVKVDRRGLNGEIELRLEDLPKGVQAKVLPILTNKTEATIQLKVSQQAETGKEHQFRVVASATHQDRVWRQKTQPIHLTLAAPESEPSVPTNKPAAKPAAEKAKP